MKLRDYGITFSVTLASDVLRSGVRTYCFMNTGYVKPALELSKEHGVVPGPPCHGRWRWNHLKGCIERQLRRELDWVESEPATEAYKAHVKSQLEVT